MSSRPWGTSSSFPLDFCLQWCPPHLWYLLHHIQPSLIPSLTVFWSCTTGNIQAPLPLAAFLQAIHLSSPSFWGPWPAAEGQGPLKALMKYWSPQLIITVIKKEMELRLSVGKWWGATVCLHHFTLAGRVIRSERHPATEAAFLTPVCSHRSVVLLYIYNKSFCCFGFITSPVWHFNCLIGKWQNCTSFLGGQVT